MSDWADVEATELMAIVATTGQTTQTRCAIAKRLRDGLLYDRQGGHTASLADLCLGRQQLHWRGVPIRESDICGNE